MLDRTSGLRALSKITAPLHAQITPNARLFARLDALRERSVVWIHGLPGAGKTSLIASWLGARGLAPIWYRLDDGDSDPASLFVFLSRAAVVSAPGIDVHLPRLTPQHVLPAYARLFFQALFSYAAAPALVFDDYHEIDAGAATHALLAGGLAEAPSGVTVFVVSRGPPPPEFARLRANGKLAVIGPDDLRLTADEARAVVRGRDARLPDAVAETIVAHTQGWTAGLVLILEAIETSGGALPCPGAAVPEVLFDYFAGEVFRRMDAVVQDQLLSLAFLPAMTEATAVGLTGSTDVVHTLDRLVRRSYFTTRDAQVRPSYRFHPLFHEFLRTTARQAWPSDRGHETRRRAATLLEEAGQPEAAIQLFVESDAWTEVVAVILRWAPVLDGEGRVRTLSGWLDRLPAGMVAQNGWLSYWTGWAVIGLRPLDSRPHFLRARALFEQADDRSGLLLALSAISESIRLDPFGDSAQLDWVIANFSDILSRDPTYPSPEVETRVAIGMYVALERRKPGHPDREAWRDRALALARAHPQSGRLEHIGFAATIYDLTAARLVSARAMFDALPDPATLSLHPLARQLGFFAKAYLQTEGHYPGDPGATAQEAVEDAQCSGMYFWTHVTLAMAAQHAMYREDVAEAERWIAMVRDVVDPGILSRSSHHLTILARQELMTGRLEPARRLSEQAVERAAASGWLFQEAWSRRSFAEILQRLGDFDAAERQLCAEQRIRERMGLQGGEFVRLLLLANQCFARGREAEGLEGLREALAVGRRMEMRQFRVTSATVAPLFARALAAGIEVDYVRELIRRRGMPPPDPDVEAWPRPIKIATFGGFAIRKDEAPLAFGRKSPRRLIELLKAIVAFGGADVPEAQVIDALWPEEEGDAARQSFTVAIHRLRKLLGDPRSILLTGGRVGLNPELCWLDLWSFERLLDGRGPDEPADRRQERALALYRGDFLAGDEDLSWTAPRRELARRRYVRACAEFAETHGRERCSDAALDVYRRGIEAAPTAEPLYRGLMACHRDRGERAEGLAVFRQLEAALADESGRRPAPESIALNRALAG